MFINERLYLQKNIEFNVKLYKLYVKREERKNIKKKKIFKGRFYISRNIKLSKCHVQQSTKYLEHLM